MRLVASELLESREILPGQWLQSFHAPELATGSRAGQFVHVRTGDYSGLVLRRPFSINTADPATGVVTIHYRTIGRGTEWFTRLRPGDSIDMLGPLGRPFEVDPRSRHLLLIAGGLGMAGVRYLADEAIRDGRQVTLLFGAARRADVYPSSLLPDEVEYVIATDDGSVGRHGFVTELVPEYEAWADQAFACGPAGMLGALARLAAGRRERMGVARLGRKRGGGREAAPGSPAARRKAFLQVSMEQNMGCAVGRVPRLRGDGDERHAAAGLPGGAGLRVGRDRLGGRLVTRSVTAVGPPAGQPANGAPRRLVVRLRTVGVGTLTAQSVRTWRRPRPVAVRLPDRPAAVERALGAVELIATRRLRGRWNAGRPSADASPSSDERRGDGEGSA